MKIFSLMFLALFLFAGVVYAKDDSYKEAEVWFDAGDYAKAEDILKKIIASEPNNARYRQLLGDVYRKGGRLDEALAEYETAKKIGGENAELLKKIGTTQKWMKNYKAAAVSYKKALQLNPKDEEAKADLEGIELKSRFRLQAMAGGWEADYTKESYEIMLSYSGVDKLDLNAGYSYADQIYYTRHKFYANGYYFYNLNSYIKLNLAYKDYNYPIDPAVQKPNPDSNSYDIVPVIEVEVSHWLRQDLRGTLAYEYFRPNFFHDKDSTADNHKISAELYYITSFEPLRFKLMYALLRDPDPKKTEVKGRNNPNTPSGAAAATDIQYQTQSLIGVGAEYVRGKWNAELKYMPNRDLDSSYKYSVFAGAGYEFTDKITGRFDYVHDEYSTESNYSGKTANVYLASVFHKVNPSIDLGIGYKFIDLPTKDYHAGFLTIAYKTGLGF